MSWLHQLGGAVALNLAKCAVTCLALTLLVTARKRQWPIWVILLAWLPALFVLSGRIYVRPETLTLLYLSIFLAVILRWDVHPRLVMLLPLAQVLWVNSHGLFILGPIVLACGLLDAALRFGFSGRERRAWWRMILVGSLATAVACLINPYFIAGAIYPLELAGTMRNPVFSKNIAELMSVPDFIRTSTWRNLPLIFHLTAIFVGAVSFLLPMAWRIGVRLTGAKTDRSSDPPISADAAVPERKSKRRRRMRSKQATPPTPAINDAGSRSAPVAEGGETWHLSPFRLALFVAFCLLSMQATRNTHQFAAVVGTITAWNFGEWAAAMKRNRPGNDARARGAWHDFGPRLAVLGVLVLLLALVGSGQYFKWTGEGRTIGLGEQPYFFPHEAARFAGGPGMPSAGSRFTWATQRFTSITTARSARCIPTRGSRSPARTFSSITLSSRSASGLTRPAGRTSSMTWGVPPSWSTTNSSGRSPLLFCGATTGAAVVRPDRRGVCPRLQRRRGPRACG